MRTTKFIKLINNERINVRIASEKACVTDVCAVEDRAFCTSYASDVCVKDYAACTGSAFDYCGKAGGEDYHGCYQNIDTL